MQIEFSEKLETPPRLISIDLEGDDGELVDKGEIFKSIVDNQMQIRFKLTKNIYNNLKFEIKIKKESTIKSTSYLKLNSYSEEKVIIRSLIENYIHENNSAYS